MPLENSSRPYIIGLVGNMGVGKSLVRKMLERLGGLGIDADMVSHRVLLKTSPVYRQVVEAFGADILNKKGEIDRKKLSSRVFSSPGQLRQLENFVHPAVETACKKIISASAAPFVVIEAIKLLESGLVNICDSIWAVNVPLEIQIERVMHARGMTRTQALERIRHQSPPEIKTRSAQVVIENSSSMESTWKQVTEALTTLRNADEHLAHSFTSHEQWMLQYPFIRFLQPTNSLLTRKLICAAQPVDWLNSWISSAIHQYTEQLKMVSRSDFFEMLVNFQGILFQPQRKPELLSIIRFENFIAQPLYLFKLNQQKELDLEGWLNTVQVLANCYCCEAVIIPIPKKMEFITRKISATGFKVLPPEDSLGDFWKTEIARTSLTGYNVMAKRLHNVFTPD